MGGRLRPGWSAIVGTLALLVVAELVARLHGERLCSDHAGVVYERDAALGWRHVPDLSGWAGTCDSATLPAAPFESDGEGFVGPHRPLTKPPGTVRFLLLGGNVPEGIGVSRQQTLAGFLELLADEARGARLEVLNGATGGWALDNSLEFFRRHGAARGADLVILVLDPLADLVTISPGYLAALGRRVPAKPFFSLVDGRLEQNPPFVLAPGPAPAPPPGPLAFSRLYRLLRGTPGYAGEPMAWALSGTFPHGTAEEERERSVALAGGLLRALRDEVSAAGGRLVTVMAPLPGSSAPEGTGRVERERLTALTKELGIPLLDLTEALDPHDRMLRPKYFPGTVRLNASGHALAAGALWGFLGRSDLLPSGLVSARVPGSGRAIPSLASLPAVVGDALWASRDGVAGRFVQFGLLAVCVVWLVAPLPAVARDWVLTGLGVAMLGIFGSSQVALIGLGFVLAWYAVVELLPPLPATAIAILLALGLVGITVRAQPVELVAEPWLVLVATASSIALLRLVAYAVDRWRGTPRLRLRTFLAAMLFFPTLAAGPIQSPTAFAASAGAPAPAVLLRSLGRLAWGWIVFVVAPLFLGLRTTDVFVTRGDGIGWVRLWLFVGELALAFTLLLAGWSHMAIGLARLAGADPPENLRRPWLAPDVAEFWRRWHATLTAWFHDYLYTPLGRGAAPVAVVFLASAVWHGWAMTKILGLVGFPPPRAWRGFVIWAVLNAAAVIVVHARAARGGDAETPPRGAAGALGTSWRVVATALFVSLAWLPLALPQLNSLRDLGAIYLRLFGLR